jgi:hypothetical protein
MVPRTLLVSIVLLLASIAPIAPIASGQDSYYRVRLDELDLQGKDLPIYPRGSHHDTWGHFWPMWPYAVLDTQGPEGPEGEVYFDHGNPERIFERTPNLTQGFVVVRTSASDGVSGTLFLPDAQWKGMLHRSFTIPAERADPAAEEAFRRAKAVHYLRLTGRRLPGAAWFRHEADRAREGIELAPDLSGSFTRWRAHGQSDIEDTFALFSGGRAVSENLQLDRLLPTDAPEEGAEEDAEDNSIEIDSLLGITVSAIDWTPLLEGKDPQLDPLAALVPADQHALFFSSFDALTTLIDEAKELATPGLILSSEESRNAFTRERYERQLCLSLDTWTRMLGPVAIRSVAFTGSDPYLRTGSDVAMLYEANDAATLFTFIRGRQEGVRKSMNGVEAADGEIDGISWQGVVSPTRAVCSYAAIVGDAVVVTNSLAQLSKIIAVTRGAPDLARSPDYRFFRDRYSREDAEETALLVVPDEAIRRWCGPRWRIAAARRTQALAAMLDLQAAHLDELATGATDEHAIESRPEFPDLGELHLTRDGVRSETFGSLDFQTPIAELSIDRVSVREAELYALWRDGYQRNWSRFFDPIALRFTVAEARVGLDLTVMPLILGSDYEDFLELVGSAVLDPFDGDPHAEAIAHFAMALDPQSEPIRDIGDFLSGVVDRLGVSPMGWIGGSVSVYLDADPIWEDLADSEDFDEALENLVIDINDVPISVHFEVSSGLKLAAFLSTLRAFVEGTSPGMVEWNIRSHGEHKYLCLSSGQGFFDDIEIYYATLPAALVVSLHEDSLKRAIDRLTAPDLPPETETESPEREPIPALEPWLGRSVALDLRRDGLDAVQFMIGENLSEMTRLISWSNIPILNEWKRRYPDSDPLRMHELLWGERLLCPAGGRYLWNAEWQTMTSSVCGHPGVPGSEIPLPALITTLLRARTGLTFELDGLRATIELQRER